jgi:hypothetical protein
MIPASFFAQLSKVAPSRMARATEFRLPVHVSTLDSEPRFRGSILQNSISAKNFSDKASSSIYNTFALKTTDIKLSPYYGH